jgi:hypothetical protein
MYQTASGATKVLNELLMMQPCESEGGHVLTIQIKKITLTFLS